MAHPQSPHMPSSMELAGGFETNRSSQDMSCTPLPAYAQGQPSSLLPRSSLETLYNFPGIHENASSQKQKSAIEGMKLGEPESMQWSAQPTFSVDRSGQNNADYHIHVPVAPAPEDFYNYVQNGMSYNDNCNIAYAAQYPTSSCPRSYHGLNLTRLPHNVNMSESFPPAVYQIEPQRHHNATPLSDSGMNDNLMQMRDDHEHHYGSHIEFGGNSGYNSPYSDMTRASTPNDELSRFSHVPNGGDGIAVDKEQPYAQLIYQALLQADGHTMILRDIYDWFIKHTDKATASETKGWQNSIRHNLSMNGAFEKVDQPCEESRKGFMWRLTDEAIREGVKSTTRYRSKQPIKRGHRSHHPQPQRQASGAKGGQATRRSATLKRSKRVHDHFRTKHYISRSVPAAFDQSYNIEPSMSYSPSPYFGFDTHTTLHDHGNLELFPPTRSFNGLPLGDAAYMLSQSPSEPLFTTSPTPSAEEPRTPMSQGDWDDVIRLGAECAFSEEMEYQDYNG